MKADEICILTRNYANPIPEGRTQASINLADSILASGVRAKIFSIGYPFKTTKYGRMFWHLNPDLIGLSDGLGLRYPSSLLPLIDGWVACLLNPLLRGRILYMLNVNALIYSIIFKLLKTAKQSDAKVVTHVLEPILPETKPYTSKQYAWLLKRGVIDYVLCVNKSLVQQFSNIIDDNCVYFVPYPIDTSIFQPRSAYEARKALNLPLDACIVGFIGHLDPERGVFDLLKAFAKLQTYNDTLLAVAPSPFTDMKSFQAFLTTVERMDLRERVKLLCNVAGVKLFYANMESGTIRTESFYNAVDVMVLPFRNAHYPLDPPAVLVEALSSGTPLITTPVGAIKEVVNEERGLLVEPRNTNMLKDALEYLLSDEKARQRLGLNARDYVVKNLSLEVIGRRIKGIFKCIL